jgi:hypothetical protein
MKNLGESVFLQISPSSLFYLHFSPYNFTKPTRAFLKLYYHPCNFMFRSLYKIYHYDYVPAFINLNYHLDPLTLNLHNFLIVAPI